MLGIVAFSLILEPRIQVAAWQQLDNVRLTNVERTITILDNKNNKINDLIYDANKIFTPLESLNSYTVDAFTSIEDQRFYNHNGIDMVRILSAVQRNIFSGSFKEGASTISQQLIKNTHLSSEKNISRKLQEMRISIDLERNYTKKEIIEMYLNILYFGNNIYGIGTASKVMFDKPASKLSIAESALLAGIINNPSKFSPYKNYENSIKRRNLVLSQMLKCKKITALEYESALNEKINLNESTKLNNHYINGVIDEACRILECSKNQLYSGGYTITSNLDKENQGIIGNILDSYTLPQNALSQIIVIENSSGKVISTNGIGNYNYSNIRRQPGSTIKPILCYVPAIEKKLISPISPILDEKTNFGNYSPSNYQNKYYGWTNVQDSLMNSLNIPAVKLLEMSGIEYSKTFAKRAGIPFDNRDTSLNLALGGFYRGVTLNDIAETYQTFANEGVHIESAYIRHIQDKNGKILYKNNQEKTQVMKSGTAYMINEMLGNCAKFGTAKKLSGITNVCAKTGTVGTKDGNTDAYTIAYNKDYTVAVWIGSQAELLGNNITGGGLPAKIASSIFNKLPTGKSFIQPIDIIKLDIDTLELNENHRVMLAAEDIPKERRKKTTFSTENIPKEYSHYKQYDIFSEEFWDFELDFDNFKIIEGLFD